ncbi:sine oculis-binding protein homolog A-like isoform X2 [Pecten maximus]|nr:sine oculis-binding protein homolog A-like isoform X2 [Pecten maximus]
MNELLGWYGYDKVNSADTEHLNLERYTSIDDVRSPTDGGSRDDDSILSDDDDDDDDDDDSLSGRSDFSRLSRSNSESSLAAQHRNLVSALTKKHGLTGAPDGTLPSGYITCAWCQKPGIKLFTLKTSTTTKAFCSEVCFTQCRRASFKKNRVCDWCKHVRHTVNYVDFQDGEQQLQFCSAKCLNQYKMKIFCKETQEHLQQIQTQNENVSSSKSPDRQILITPDLWLKDSTSADEKSESKPSEATSHRDSQKETNSNRGNHRENHREGQGHKEKTGHIHRDSHREDREKIRKHSSKTEWRSDSHKSHSHGEIDRSRSVMDRLVRERHRRSSSKDSTCLASPQLASTDPSPAATSSAQPNPMFANPAGYPSMPLIPPHLWGAFGPGMPPMGHIPPWFYGGYMPQVPGLIPGGQIPNTEGEFRPPNSRMSTPTPTRPTLSPDSSSPSTTPNTNLPSAKQGGTSTSTGSAKCPQKVSGITPLLPGIPNNGNPQSVLGYDPNLVGPGYRPGSQYLGGMPPVTMIMPIPFPLPVPFPVPLPLPLKMEQIMEVYNKKQEEKKKEKEESVPQRIQSDKHLIDPQRNHRIKTEFSDSSDSEILKKPEKTSLHCVSYSERASSVTSCPDLSDIHSSAHDLSTRKRPLTPRLDGSLDLSKRPRSEVNTSPDSYDGVIDLSMDSSLTRYKMSPGKENRETNESDISQDGEERDISNGELGLKIPRIHIITPRSEPPLNAQLPLPPAEHKYSNRRGLILDAPCTPNRPRSPSPERRSYVRSVPRDVMEAARRRCLRARIRTK